MSSNAVVVWCIGLCVLLISVITLSVTAYYWNKTNHHVKTVVVEVHAKVDTR
jgi:hypothetical protein